jgi:acyl-coenzyme A synthetase/AMP-(fatty) acid ligase
MLQFMNRAGNALLSRGVKKDDRVVLATGNRVELGLLNFACHKIEAVPVPVNYMYRAQEIKRIVDDSGASVLITDREVFVKSIKDRAVFPDLRECLALDMEPPPGCASLGRMMEQSSPELVPAPGRDLRDVVQIFYSSGTTGVPKGALLTRLGYLYLIRSFLGLGALAPGKRRDLLVTSLPLAHIMGMCLFIIRLATSTPWYFINRFDPDYVLDMIQKKRASSFIGVPAMFSMIMRSGPEKYDLKSVLLWGSAADAMPPELLDRVMKLKPRRYFLPVFVEVYGQVETGGPTSLRISTALRRPKSRSLGLPLPWVKTRVVDEELRPVKRGQVGELLVKSPMVTVGYWKRPEANQSAFLDGWFRTGDLVRRRGLGIEFAGRRSDRIKCGGYSVFPQEVEEELILNPEILEAAVVGISDEVKGQIPVAAVVLRPRSSATEEQILEWAKQNIAGFKRPRRIKVLTELPRGATQKILKNEIIRIFNQHGPEGPPTA